MNNLAEWCSKGWVVVNQPCGWYFGLNTRESEKPISEYHQQLGLVLICPFNDWSDGCTPSTSELQLHQLLYAFDVIH